MVKTDEELAEKYGIAWSQFFLDNPRFVSWMAYTLNKIRNEQKSVDNAE